MTTESIIGIIGALLGVGGIGALIKVWRESRSRERHTTVKDGIEERKAAVETGIDQDQAKSKLRSDEYREITAGWQKLVKEHDKMSADWERRFNEVLARETICQSELAAANALLSEQQNRVDSLEKQVAVALERIGRIDGGGI